MLTKMQCNTELMGLEKQTLTMEQDQLCFFSHGVSSTRFQMI